MTKTRKELGALIAKLQEKQEQRAKTLTAALVKPILKNDTLVDQLDELSKSELQEVARRMADSLGTIIAEVRADAVPASPDQRQSERMDEAAAGT